MTALVAVLAGVLGLAIGSFLNVVIHRVPAGTSLLRPASACPACGHAIRWYDNIPVISWIVLRGRCRDCGEPISVRYPLVEAGTAVAFVLVALCLAPGGWLAPVASGTAGVLAQFLVLLAYLWLAAASIALTAIDIDVKRLPDAIVLPSIVVLVVTLAGAAALTGDLWGILRALIGGAVMFVFYLLLAVVSRGGMGFGDVKLSAALGLATAWIGWDALVVGALAAFVLGGLFGIVVLLLRRAGRRSAVPFGPWMIAGAWLGIVAGPTAWSWYAAVLGLPEGV
jgi:leader peptidase (prepilin peptidase)/N-methyltransferase